MCAHGRVHSLVHMKQRLLFVLLIIGLLALAVGGWTVEGLRWAVSGGRMHAVSQSA
jgi:hypothetical protein